MRFFLTLFLLSWLGIASVLAEQPGTVNLTVPVLTLIEQIECSDEVARAMEISSADDRFIVEAPEFVQSPIIHSNAVCRTFLKKWSIQLRENGITELKIALERSDNPHSKETYHFADDNFADACVSLGFCMRDIFDYFKLRHDLVGCQPTQTWESIRQRMSPRSLRPDYQPIPEVKVEAFPFVPLVRKLREYTLRESAATFASTMTIGNGTVGELMEDLKGHGNDIFVALDAGVMFAVDQALFLAQRLAGHTSLHMIPITSGQGFNTLHHWKIVVNDSGSQSTISSMNFSTPSKTPFMDLAYSFDDPDVTAELRGLLLEALKAQCARSREFECFVDFAYSGAPEREATYRLLEDSCSALNKAVRQTGAATKKYFMQPQDTDLEYLVRSLIREAKHEIVLLSHKFYLPELLKDLDAASKRGVRVSVFTTVPPPGKKLLPAWFYYPEKLREGRHVPAPHMKAMIVDGAAMFFGSGNFTQNAFHDARELFAVTKDKVAIEEVLRFAASLYNAHVPASKHRFGLDSANENWVVMNEHPPLEADKLALIESVSERDERPWMSNYWRVTSEASARLRECNLDQLRFIPAGDLASCLKH